MKSGLREQGHSQHVQDVSIYAERKLVDKGHFISYWHQINEVTTVSPTEVLEIGVGNRFLSGYLRERGLDITAVDVESILCPDIVGTLIALPFQDSSFDTVVCFEVLEHMPFDQSLLAMKEIARVARRHIIISVPDASRTYRIHLRLPGINARRIIEFFPDLKLPPVRDDGPQYWEIGQKGYPLRRVTDGFQRAGLKVEKTYRVFEYVRHRFFVLSKEHHGE
jgi:SAM-dependent methyltransferase